MNCMDPLPHLRLAKMLPETPVQCPVCKQNFKAIEGFAFLTFWHAEGRAWRAGTESGLPDLRQTHVYPRFRE